MKKYIEVGQAIKALEKEVKGLDAMVNHNYREGLQFALKMLNERSAADVQEVIRCKDCKFWDSDGYCEGTQNGLIREYTKPDDFCSYGERKEADE